MLRTCRLYMWVLCAVLIQPVCAHAFAQALLDRAGQYYADGRYLEALSFYRDIVRNSRSDEQRAAACFGLGLLFDGYLADYEPALVWYARHVELQGPDSARALHYSARILVRQDLQEEALRVYRDVVRRFPGYAEQAEVHREIEAQVHADGAAGTGSARDITSMIPAIVRVLIEDAPGPVAVAGSPDLIVVPDDAAGEPMRHERQIVFSADGSTLLINGVPGETDTVMVRGSRDDRLRVNGRRYRSSVSVRATQGRVLVINHVCLENYLYGVLPREVYVSWPPAVLQAQAVAARTYALYHMALRNDRAYDVLSTTSSQVYGGLDREHAATNAAVDATRAQVLTCGDRFALTLYHANSGGAVEAVEDVWEARLPYLRRVIDVGSLEGRGARWSCSLSRVEIISSLNSYGFSFETIDRIEPVSRSGSGRVTLIAVEGGKDSVVLGGNSLRLMLGPAAVKSTRFVVEPRADSFYFTGSGYGHGVGMSQWGAQALAGSGSDYREILAHYYPGTTLVRLTACTRSTGAAPGVSTY